MAPDSQTRRHCRRWRGQPVQPHRRIRPDQSGSALILVPAGVLILVILAALALDSALVYLGQRQLANAAASAASDGAGAISNPSFYGSGSIVLDPSRAIQSAAASVATQEFSGIHLVGPPSISVDGVQVCVSLHASVPHLLGRIIPGIPHDTTVSARATATAAGQNGSVVPTRRVC